MKFSLYFLFIIIFVGLIYSQNKYIIHFIDKGKSYDKNYNETKLEKYLYSLYSERAIQKRKILFGEKIFSEEDYPISEFYLAELEKINITPIVQLRWQNLIYAFLDNRQLEKLKNLPFITKIEKCKNYIPRIDYLNKSILSSNNSTFFDSLQYGASFLQNALHRVDVLHNANILGEGILLGFLDTGFRWRKHLSLMNSKVIAEYDFINKDTITENHSGDSPSQDEHGTYVMSIVAGFAPAKLIGIAPKASFILGKTENLLSETRAEEEYFAAAIEWMELYGVDIISSSLGYNTFDDPNQNYSYKDMNGETSIVAKAVDKAYLRGITILTSAGNEGNTSWKYILTPADAKYVISVGGVNSQKILSGFSSIGPTSDGRIKPDVVALAEGIYGANHIIQDGYKYSSGNSASTPIVGGIATLLLSHYKELFNYQIRDAIRSSSSNWSTPNNQIGWGIVDAVEVLSFPQIIKRKSGSDSNYVLYKSFFNNNIDSSSISIIFDNKNFQTGKFVSISKNKYEIAISKSLPIYDKIRFYFTYKDLFGNSFRLPIDSSSTFSMVISDQKVYNASIPINNITSFELLQNYPNPFNHSTRISFKLPLEQSVNITIYDILGNEVKKLVANSNFSRGEHNSIIWDGKDNFNRLVTSGVYFYRFSSDKFTFTKKLIYLK